MKTVFQQPRARKGLRNLFLLLLLNSAFIINPFFTLKTFAQGGPVALWTKQFGGFENESISNWVETPDGGYLLGATSESHPGKNKTAPNKGEFDYWIVKIDKNGNKLWDKSYGGSASEHLQQIIALKDGNFLLAGYSSSPKSGDKSENFKGEADFWIVKISPTGTKLWDKTIGGNRWDEPHQMIERADGTIILAGYSASDISGDRTDFSRGSGDIWLVKINTDGSKVWDKAYGGKYVEEYYSGNDYLYSIKAAPDGGYYLLASSDSYKGYEKSEDPFVSDPNSRNKQDGWLLKIDANGKKVWDKSYGGFRDDDIYTIEYWPNGRLLINGRSGSPISGNKTVAPAPDRNGTTEPHSWFITTDLNGNILNQSYSLSTYSYIAAADGYYTLSRPGVQYYATYLEKYNWSNQRLWRKTLELDYENWPGSPVITKTGHLMIGYGALVNNETYDGDFFIEKYDNKLYTPNPADFYRAINLNSSIASLTVDNVSYVGSKVASNFTYTGRAYENQGIPLVLPPDANKAKMLRSTIYSTKTTPSTFNFLNVPNGNYEVFLYVWEDNYSTSYSVIINHEYLPTFHDYESGPRGTWERLGPFRIAVTNGQINIKAYEGDANISGIALYKYNGTMPAALASAPNDAASTVALNKTGIKAYPNSISNKLSLSFDEKTEGKANVTLLDMSGHVLKRVESKVQDNSALINLPADQLNPGLYLLKVKTSRGEKVIRLHKK